MNILLIDKEKFIRDLFQAICKKDKVDLYSVDTIAENGYLIDDLAPDYIVADYETVSENLSYLQDNLKSAKKLSKLVCLIQDEVSIDPEFKKNCSGIILKPLSPTNLISQIQESVI